MVSNVSFSPICRGNGIQFDDERGYFWTDGLANFSPTTNPDFPTCLKKGPPKSLASEERGRFTRHWNFQVWRGQGGPVVKHMDVDVTWMFQHLLNKNCNLNSYHPMGLVLFT